MTLLIYNIKWLISDGDRRMIENDSGEESEGSEGSSERRMRRELRKKRERV